MAEQKIAPSAAALKASLDPYSPEDQSIIDDIVSEHDKDLAMQAGNKEMAKSAASSMSAGGSPGSTLTGAGVTGLISGANPWAAGGAAAAGLALSFYEQKKQAKAAHEREVIEEQQNRKSATQNAINGAIAAARSLGVS
jgi:hypothetical protein